MKKNTNSETCPNCKGLLEADGTCSCGWAPKKRGSKTNDLPRLCAWNDSGDSCRAIGHLSLATHGAGPWYCRSHFADLMGWPRWELPSPDPHALIVTRVPGQDG